MENGEKKMREAQERIQITLCDGRRALTFVVIRDGEFDKPVVTKASELLCPLGVFDPEVFELGDHVTAIHLGKAGSLADVVIAVLEQFGKVESFEVLFQLHFRLLFSF